MPRRLTVLCLCLATLLSGCQSTPSTPPPSLDDPRDLERWTLDGRLGYRSANDGGSASFHWVQDSAAEGSIHFSGPLGFGSARIGWQPGKAWLERGDERVQAASPGLLAWRLTGLMLPIESLHYWVRGVPAPGPAPTALETNAEGRLQHLRQAGWTLEFDRYQPVAGASLPHRIKATHGEDRFTLLIRSWQPRS